MEEMIVSACVRFHTKEYNKTPWDDNTKVPSKRYEIPCHRHCDAFYIISQFIARDEIDKTKTEQGFLTEADEFLDRHAAMDEAIRCKQLPPEAKQECAELYSEDLW